MRPSPSTSASRLLRVLTAALALCAAATVASAAPEAAPRLRVVVELDATTLPEGWLRRAEDVGRQRFEIAWRQSGLAADMTGRDFRIVRRYRALPFVAAELSVREIAALATSPWVRSISGDDPLRPSVTRSVDIVEAPRAWTEGLDGSGWTLAVLDTGVDRDHPYLAGKVVSEACFSALGSCPDGGEQMLGDGAGIPCDYSNGCVHGTHVAGIAVGESSKLSGVAPGGTLVSVQVFSRFDGAPFCDDGESCPLAYTSDLIAGLEHVYDLRDRFAIAAVNMSLGGGYYSSPEDCDLFNGGVKAAIDQLRSVGIATVVAAGNDGFRDGLAAPGCISSAISVGSTNGAGRISSFSNTASFLSLLAPGSGILSSIPGGGFASLSGTSMATPHVTGAWAIMKQADPEASVDAVLTRLRKTGTWVHDDDSDLTRRLIQLDGATRVSAADAEHDVRIRNLAHARRLKADRQVPIRWSATPGVASFDVWYTTDGGASWQAIATGLSASSRRIYWTVPRLPVATSRCKVRVQGFDSQGVKVATDRNGAWLSIRPVP